MRQDIFSRGPIFGAGAVIGTPLRRARIRSTTMVTRPAAARPIVKADEQPAHVDVREQGGDHQRAGEDQQHAHDDRRPRR